MTNKLIEKIKHNALEFEGRYLVSAFDVQELKGMPEGFLANIASKFDRPISIFDAYSELDIPAFLRAKKKIKISDEKMSERTKKPQKFYLSEFYFPNDGTGTEKRKTYNTTLKGKKGMLDIYDNGKEKFIEFLETK